MKKLLMMMIGSLFVSIGVFILNSSGLVIGGTVGLSIILHHYFNLPLSWLMFSINIPFYLLSFYFLGVNFTRNTFISVTLLSLFSSLLQSMLNISSIQPLIGAIIGGIFVGSGLFILFYYVSSIGGMTIVAATLAKKYNIKNKNTIFVSDFIIVSSSLLFSSLHTVIFSIVAVFITSFVVDKVGSLKKIK